MVGEKRALAEEIARILETPRQGDDEITTREYSEFSGYTLRQAYAQLMKAVADGKMTKRDVLVNRHWCGAYKVVRDEETADRHSDAV